MILIWQRTLSEIVVLWLHHSCSCLQLDACVYVCRTYRTTLRTLTLCGTIILLFIILHNQFQIRFLSLFFWYNAENYVPVFCYSLSFYTGHPFESSKEMDYSVVELGIKYFWSDLILFYPLSDDVSLICSHSIYFVFWNSSSLNSAVRNRVSGFSFRLNSHHSFSRRISSSDSKMRSSTNFDSSNRRLVVILCKRILYVVLLLWRNGFYSLCILNTLIRIMFIRFLFGRFESDAFKVRFRTNRCL